MTWVDRRRKAKKAAIFCVVLSFLMLAGCKEKKTQEFPDSPMPGMDAQNQYLCTGIINFQETEDFFCGTNMDGMQLQYYDKESGVSGVLCPDPACNHDTGDCSAKIDGSSLSVYDGKFYWVAPKGIRERALYRSDLSGTNREELRVLDPDKVITPYQPQWYMVHRGNLYFLGRANIVEGTRNRQRITLQTTPLEGNEDFTILYQEIFDAGSEFSVRFVGNYVYLSCVSFEAAGGPFDITIIRYNTETQTGEELYTEKGVSQYLGQIWVTEQGEIYLPGAGEGKAYVWKIQDGQRKEMLSWEDGDDSPPDLLDEVVVHMTRKEYTRWLNVMDYTGKTLYEGKLFPQPVPGLEGDPGVFGDPQTQGPEYGFALVGGDSQKLIIHLNAFQEGMVDYTLMLDLTDNLKPTVLWSDTVNA